MSFGMWPSHQASNGINVWHVGMLVTADIIASWASRISASTRRHACQAVRPSNVLIFTHCKKLSIIIIATHVNMHRIAFFPDVSRQVYQKDKKFYCNELENLVRHHNYTNRKLLLSALHKATFTSYHHMEMSILLYISFLDFCVMVRVLQN